MSRLRTPIPTRAAQTLALFSVAALPLVASVGFGALLALPSEAEAQRSAGKISSSSTRGTSTGQYRGHGRYRGATPPAQRQDTNRHLRSPMGSAANVGTGWYQLNLGQPQYDPHDNGYGHGVPHYGGYSPGYVVYVDTQGGEPQVYGHSEPSPQPVIVQPPPVYIIQPPAQAPPQPTTSPPAAEPQWTPPEPESPRPSEPQAVSFHIEPADARVFLDDDYLGTAAEVLARSPLVLDPGVYLLAVSHPEFGDTRLFFGVDGIEPTAVGVDLTSDHPRRRTRVD